MMLYGIIKWKVPNSPMMLPLQVRFSWSVKLCYRFMIDSIYLAQVHLISTWQWDRRVYSSWVTRQLLIIYTVIKPAVQIPYKPCRYRKYIWDNIPMHAIFCCFYLLFHTVLSRSYFTSRTPDKDQKIEQLFYLYCFKSYNTETPMSSVA